MDSKNECVGQKCPKGATVKDSEIEDAEEARREKSIVMGNAATL